MILRYKLYVAAVILVCMTQVGCIGHTTRVSGNTLHASLLGMDVADITLPDHYTYSGTTRFWLGENQSVPCQMKLFVSESSTFGFCAVLVEPKSVVLPEKGQLMASPYIYDPAVGTNALAPQPGELPAGYRVRAFTRLFQEEAIIHRTINAHKDGHYLIATYIESLQPGDPCLQFPPLQRDFTEAQKLLLVHFEDRADQILGKLSLH